MKRLLPLLSLALLLTSCATTPEVTTPPGIDADVLEARVLYQDGRMAEALMACIDIAHTRPHAPGLAPLQADIMTAINERRQLADELRRDDSTGRMILESMEDTQLPDTYDFQRTLQGNDSTHVRPRNSMAATLDQHMALHFDEVDLRQILTYLGQEKQVNIIADQNLNTPPVTIHAEDITLRELFDYLSRNLDIDFHMSRNLVWVTPAAEPRSATPLFTRLYRLRHGAGSAHLGDDGLDPQTLTLLDAIDRFVPVGDGTDLMFDPDSHILLVKNTERNLGMVDRLVEALDVTPPQVLIEARFITTSISDLRELGIDWLLQSDYVTSTTGGQTRSQVNSGAAINFGESLNAGDGLTATFSGILTDPQFQAVLHALELQGDSRTLSAPRVIAVNNRPAHIRIGRDLAYISDIDIERETYGTGDNREELLIRDPVVDTLETGYQLDASVSVGANRRDITMRLRPEIVELIRFREVSQTVVSTNDNANVDLGTVNIASAIEFPEVARSEIETEVIVQSGETVVMGGLMRQREQNEIRGVPVLSYLPIIGRLFQRSTVTREQENLLVFVTANLISKHGENLVPVTRRTPDEAETRGRFIENNAPVDESITD